jgi:hypothetical protein
MNPKPLSFVAIKVPEHFKEEEEMGYDVPFQTISWEQWMGIQAKTIQSFARFQRAIEQGHVIIAHDVTREFLEIYQIMQKEAGQWIGIKPGIE